MSGLGTAALFLAIVLAAAALAVRPQRSAGVRAGGYVAFLLALAAFWYGIAGTPRAGWLGFPAGKVVAAVPDAAAGRTYLWLLPDGAGAPLAVSVPYSKRETRMLLMRLAKAAGGKGPPLRIKRQGFGHNAPPGFPEGKWVNWPEPQKGPPPKAPMTGYAASAEQGSARE
jgi:hypothetical protein